VIARLASLLVVVIGIAATTGCAGLPFLPSYLQPKPPLQQYIFEHFDAAEVPVAVPSEDLSADFIVLAHNRMWVRTTRMPDLLAIAFLYIPGDEREGNPRRDIDALEEELAGRLTWWSGSSRRLVLFVPQGAEWREPALVDLGVAAGFEVKLARRRGTELRAYKSEDLERHRDAQRTKADASLSPVDPKSREKKGSLERSAISDAVQASLPRIKACYDRSLYDLYPTLEGKLVSKYTIGGEGRVIENGFADDTMGDRRVSQCIRKVMQTLTYPPPMGGGEVYVTYPFVFAASD